MLSCYCYTERYAVFQYAFEVLRATWKRRSVVIPVKTMLDVAPKLNRNLSRLRSFLLQNKNLCIKLVNYWYYPHKVYYISGRMNGNVTGERNCQIFLTKFQGVFILVKKKVPVVSRRYTQFWFHVTTMLIFCPPPPTPKPAPLLSC